MGSIYYHGTNKKNVDAILKEGFKEGTYFTWDLHSALAFGGMHIFAIYFPDKEIKDYWELIIDKVIQAEEILYYRIFTVECVYDNEDAREALTKLRIIKERGEDTIHCTKWKGSGKLNKVYEYTAWRKDDKLRVCDICKGFGCLQSNKKPWNES